MIQTQNYNVKNFVFSKNIIFDLKKMWQSLPRCPSKQMSNMVQIDDTRFIVAPYYYSGDEMNGILCYDTINEEWKILARYPKEYFNICYHSIVFDKNKNKIFMSGVSPVIGTLDLKTKEFSVKTATRFTIGRTPAMLMIDDKCHVMFGGDNKQHLIWNDDIQKFEVYDSMNKNEIDFTKGLYNHGWCYRSSRKEILIFGGFDYGNKKRYDRILRYSFEDKKWSEMEMKLAMKNGIDSCGVLLVRNQRYVMLFGGFSGKGCKGWIFVIDLLMMKSYESKLKCPMAEYHAILMKDYKQGVIARGYLRILQKQEKNVLPVELVGLLIEFYQSCYVHLLDRETGSHYKIDLGVFEEIYMKNT